MGCGTLHPSLRKKLRHIANLAVAGAGRRLIERHAVAQFERLVVDCFVDVVLHNLFLVRNISYERVRCLLGQMWQMFVQFLAQVLQMHAQFGAVCDGEQHMRVQSRLL